MARLGINTGTLPNDGTEFTDRSVSNNAICRLLTNIKLKYVYIKNTEEELRQSYQQAEIQDFKYYCLHCKIGTNIESIYKRHELTKKHNSILKNLNFNTL